MRWKDFIQNSYTHHDKPSSLQVASDVQAINNANAGVVTLVYNRQTTYIQELPQETKLPFVCQREKPAEGKTKKSYELFV